MLTSFRYRLVPSTPHAWRLDRSLEPCRRRENRCRVKRRDASQERDETIGTFEQIACVKELKASDPSAKNVHRHVLHVVVAGRDNAVGTFFRRVKAGENPGYPQFKGRNRFDSFGFTEDGNGFTPDGRRLRLSGNGRVAVRWHRPLEGQIKTMRIIRRSGQWYACFACEGASAPLATTGKDIGIDGGIASLITTSEDEQVAHPAWYRAAQRTLRVLHRRVALRTKGSTNRREDVRMRQRQHERRANRRTDVLTTPGHGLIAHSDRIALKDLRVTTMVRNRHPATSIVDAGWGSLVPRLTSTAEESGRVVTPVDPRYPSKTWRRCGYVFHEQTLADRWITCACGLSLDRDHNAAINILRSGRGRWASISP